MVRAKPGNVSTVAVGCEPFALLLRLLPAERTVAVNESLVAVEVAALICVGECK